MKTCRKCHKTKPLIEFYKNLKARCKDGHHNKCKVCELEHIKKYRQTTKGKTTNNASVRRYILRYPARHRALSAVHYAIKTGKLPQPNTLKCFHCPIQAEEYHHPSYAPERKLNVVPICIKCHNSLTKKVI